MTVPIVTAVSDPRWEADLVCALAAPGLGVQVVRRCVDLPDLLAAAAAGLARAAVLSCDLRRLDRDALNRLSAAGIAVVGLVAPGDVDAERRLRGLGVAQVLPADAPAVAVAAAVLTAVGAARPASGQAFADPSASTASAASSPTAGACAPTGPGTGRLVAVWGPTGAPGRSTVAVGLAAEMAELGVPALLVDADVYGGVDAQLLGLLDESPGLAAACRLANNGTLDVLALAELAGEVRPKLRVLTGIARADRWPELRPGALEAVLDLARSLAEVVVVDCGFALERDEELAYDTMAPRRNGATLAALAAADVVVAVGSGDPVGLQRLVRGLAELREAVPEAAPMVVVNRVRRSAVGGGDAEGEIAAALQRYAGVTGAHFIPLDVGGLDACLATGQSLPEVAPSSPARRALAGLAATVGGMPVEPAAGRRRRQRRGSARRSRRAAP